MSGFDPKTVALLLALGNTIQQFTRRTPMTAEEVIQALAFTAGSACGQKEAHSRHTTRELRRMAVDAIDKGIDSATADNRPKLILPN